MTHWGDRRRVVGFDSELSLHFTFMLVIAVLGIIPFVCFAQSQLTSYMQLFCCSVGVSEHVVLLILSEISFEYSGTKVS
jgi:hypothetical protein